MIVRFRNLMSGDLKRWRRSNGVDIFFFLIAVVIVAAFGYGCLQLVINLSTLESPGAARIKARVACLEAGYSEMQQSENGFYCVGIRDGNTVTILVSELETGE